MATEVKPQLCLLQKDLLKDVQQKKKGKKVPCIRICSGRALHVCGNVCTGLCWVWEDNCGTLIFTFHSLRTKPRWAFNIHLQNQLKIVWWALVPWWAQDKV